MYLTVRLLFTIAVLMIPELGHAKHRHHEAWYRDNWCIGKGKAEVLLPDRTRCDCLTQTHAVEVDFAPKFYEAIGQALYYSLQTGKKGGIVLIVENKSDYKYWLRLNSTIEHFHLPIDTWKVQ